MRFFYCRVLVWCYNAEMQRKITSTSFFIGKGGGNLISFGSGQPDLPPPKQIYSILKDYGGFKYGQIQGEENLRFALSKDYPGAKPENFIIKVQSEKLFLSDPGTGLGGDSDTTKNGALTKR